MTLSRSCRWAFALVLCWTSLVAAQQDTGRLEGRVVKDGDGVAAVVVLISELRLTSVTDQNGEFGFDALPEGAYTVILTLGNNTASHADVFVTAGRTRELELEVDWDLGIREVVTVTAAARAAKIVDAPAAVTSIPEEQIEQQASHGQLPKVLEFTPGAEVTQSGLYDFNFNTRGFNSSLNRRVSTYIDGRDVGVVLLGAQEWAAISGGLDDVANLEFIRGPSAALYGANASSGVINITTKLPRQSQGTMLRLTGGIMNTLGTDSASRRTTGIREPDGAVDFRHAGRLADGLYYKITAGLRDSGDFTVSRNPDFVDKPEYERLSEDRLRGTDAFCLSAGDSDCLPEEKTLFREQDNEVRFGSLRLDKYLSDDTFLTFEAGGSDIEGPVFQTGIGRVQALGARRPFYRFNFSSPRWNVLAHYSSREGDQANLMKDLPIKFELLTDTERYGVEAQGNWSFAGDRVRFVIGAAHTEERVDTVNSLTGEQTVVFEPIQTDRQAIFAQVDWRAGKRFKLVFAGRVDENTLHDTQFSPKAALVYSINPKNSLRFTYNEAFQVANYSEFFLHARLGQFPLLGFVSAICESPILDDPLTPERETVDCGVNEDPPVLAVGNDDLKLEQTEAFEIGYSGLLANRVFVTVDYYNSENQDFITDLVPQVGTVLGNVDGCVDSRFNPLTDPLRCPINSDYRPWVSTQEAETTILFGTITVAQALRNAVDNSVGGSGLGFRLAQDLDGSTVVVGRTYANIGQVDTQGVDLGIQIFANDAWNLQVSYSWFDFEIADSDVAEPARCSLPPGHPNRPLCLNDILLPNTPEHKASLSVSFVKNRWAVNLSGRWVDSFRWSAGVFQGPVDEYSTVDLTASHTFTDMIRLGLNVANLRDSVHRQTYGGDLLARRALMHLTFSW